MGWERVYGGGMDPSLGHNSVRTMKVVDNGQGEDVLMMATSNYGAPSEIWTYASDGTWTKIGEVDDATISVLFVDDEGDIYATTWTDYNMYKVDQSQAGTPGAMERVTPNVDLDTGPGYDQGIIEIQY